jgi:hypothetical protein
MMTSNGKVPTLAEIADLKLQYIKDRGAIVVESRTSATIAYAGEDETVLDTINWFTRFWGFKRDERMNGDSLPATPTNRRES